MNRWSIALFFLFVMVTAVSTRSGWAQVAAAPSILIDPPKEVRINDVFERTEAPLNERLTMKYIRQVELQRRLRRIVRMHVRQSVEYDSNIRRTTNNEKQSDIIYSTRAEFNVNLLHIESPHLPDFFKEGGGINVGLTYVFVYDSYRRNDDLNNRDDIFGLDISLPTLEVPFLRRGIGRKLEVTISDDFHPEEFTNISIDNQSDRTLRFTNDFSVVLVYPINRKTFLALPYLNQFIRYKDSESKDFNSLSHTFAPTVSYYLTEKTSFFVGGRYGIYQFEDDANNFKTFTLQAGIFKVLTPKVNLGFSGGYQVRTFKRNNPTLDNNGETSDDSLGSFVFDFFYNQRISRKTNFRFSAGSGITDTLSTIGSVSSSRTLQENIDQGNPSVIQGRLNADITHSLTEKISLYGRGEVITEKQENPDRTDVLYTLGTGLTYRLRYNLSLNFSYRYSMRNADNSDNNFGDNLFTISLDYGIGGGEGLINIRRGGKALANA